jgi:hypothetical protein
MKFFFALLFLVSMLAGCASVEPATQPEEEQTTEENEAIAPGWFNPLETSRSDSTTIYGFALASAPDSAEAVLLAENTAQNNLRYEIDYLAENTREKLVEDSKGSVYEQASFIIDLRNTVRDLSLSDATMEIESRKSENGVYHVYAKASLPKNILWSIFSEQFNDSDFLNAFRSSSAE